MHALRQIRPPLSSLGPEKRNVGRHVTQLTRVDLRGNALLFLQPLGKKATVGEPRTGTEVPASLVACMDVLVNSSTAPCKIGSSRAATLVARRPQSSKATIQGRTTG